MTPSQISIIKRTVTQFNATDFYDKLFELDPALKGGLFKFTDMEEQKTKLLGTLIVAVASVDDLSKIVPTLERLGRKHKGYGVQPHHYATVETAFIYALHLTHPDEVHAWHTVYDTIATVMIKAGKELLNVEPNV